MTSIHKLFIFCSLFALLARQAGAQQSESGILSELREGLPGAFQERDACTNMLIKYSTTKSADPVVQGYLGALKIAQSRHAPLQDKLRYFRTGRDQLEMAISRKPNHLELTFLRLTIQSNLPGILGYSDNLENDKRFVRDHYTEAPPLLKKRIVTFVHQSEAFTDDEKSRFNSH